MDAHQQQALWTITQEHYEAAELCAQRGWHTVSIACSYYAVYTAMWIALGDPPLGQWSHAGIVQHFTPGQWRHGIVNLSPCLYNCSLVCDICLMNTPALPAHYKHHRFPIE